MTSKKQTSQDVQTLLGQISDAATHVDHNDLGLLAKMHSWTEDIVAYAKSTGVADTPLPKQAESIALMLESLVLGEVEDAMSSIVTLRAAVLELEATIASAMPGGTQSSSQAPSPATKASPVKPTSNEIAPAKPAPQAESATPSAAAESVIATPPSDAADSTPTTPESATNETPASNVEVETNVPAPIMPEPQSAAEAETVPTAPEPAVTAEQTIAPVADAPLEQLEAVELPPPHVAEPLKIDEKETEFVKGFVEEAGEHIEAIEAALLEVERAPDNTAHVDNLFRPFHTIKGMAGFLNLRDIGCLTHEAETLMDQARKGKRDITPGMIDLVFDVVDILKAQINAIANHLANPQGNIVPQPPVADMIGKLRMVVAGQITPDARTPATGNAANKVGENLVEQGACSQEVVEVALDSQKRAPAKKTGQILVEMGATTSKQVSQAIRPQAQAARGASQAAPASEQSVRIDTGKLDSLVDMVGELVIAQTLVSASSFVTQDPKLTKNVGQVGKIVRDVQELAMSMRMIPIGPTFQKMARLVRDVSRKAGKKVELTISGEDTELDKNVIQQIGDPLVHMVRNAVDHGVESPEDRVRAGKPETGNVHLGAYHHGGNIVIEIRDDGKGLNPKTLIAKGIEKGIVNPNDELTDQQAYALVFAPGFSTAAQVTDISGRGVGMDVVRRNIEQLRGKIEIESGIDKGSSFAIRLPLTLAIIDGMVIRVGQERFIIPTIVIEQALRPQANQITTVQRRGEVLNVRGRLIPLMQLGQIFGLTERVDPCDAMVVIANCEGQQLGLLVDELIGQQQVVIKSLGERFERIKGISGAAILGDGRVGLILEMSGLAVAHAAMVVPARNAAKRELPADNVEEKQESSQPDERTNEEPNLIDEAQNVLVEA